MTDYKKYIDAGFNIFLLNPILEDGSCGCGYSECTDIGKHPSNPGYLTPLSPKVRERLLTSGAFDRTGFGVIVDGFCVIDVDARNGGIESLRRLYAEYPDLATVGIEVRTGSGGGSCHLYYKIPEGAYGCGLEEYPGIDFKTSGYVVGAGSPHKSGKRYEALRFEALAELPARLVEKLARAEKARDHSGVEYSPGYIRELLTAINDPAYYDHYHEWFSIAAAVHTLLGPDGYEDWRTWSEQSDKYSESACLKLWRGLEKSGSRCGLTTLRKAAADCGYEEPEQEHNPEAVRRLREIFDAVHTDVEPRPPFAISQDTLHPPGFVGEVARWIDSTCSKPRLKLSVIGALYSVGALMGNRYTDDQKPSADSNLFAIGVAGSGTGKNSVYQAAMKLLGEAGEGHHIVRTVKSEREVYYNVIDQPACHYIVDEVGHLLNKISSASDKGAHYLMGVEGALMSLYSNVRNNIPMGGDEGRDVVGRAKGILKGWCDLRENNEPLPPEWSAEEESRLTEIVKKRAIVRPYVSLFGLTTRENFDAFATPQRVREGFIGRTLIAIEHNDTPEPREDFEPRDMGNELKYMLRLVAKAGGLIRTDDDAELALKAVARYAHNLSVYYRDTNNYQALPNRMAEMVSKISFILAAHGRRRKLEHVAWAFAFVYRDLQDKLHLVQSRDGNDNAQSNLVARIRSCVDDQRYCGAGEIWNRIKAKGITRPAFESALQTLVDTGQLECQTGSRGGNKYKRV